MFACSLSCLLLGQSQYTIFSQSTSEAQFSPNRRQLLNFLPIDVSCSIFFFDFDFFPFLFSAQTRFCFFEKNTFFSEPLRSRGRIYRNARVPYVSHFLHSQIPSHHLSFFCFFLFFLLFRFFVFFFSGCGAFERLRCT